MDTFHNRLISFGGENKIIKAIVCCLQKRMLFAQAYGKEMCVFRSISYKLQDYNIDDKPIHRHPKK